MHFYMINLIEDDFMTIGERIKEIRTEKGLTPKELSEKSGVSYQMIGQYEKSDSNLQISTLLKIANALNVKITDIIYDDIDEDMEINKIISNSANWTEITKKVHLIKEDL